MPIIDVEIVMTDNEGIPSHLAQTLADNLSTIFGTPPGQTWVRLRKLLAQDYAEDGDVLPQAMRPVFVTILKATLPLPTNLRHEAEQVSQMIAKTCQRPVEHVHIFYQPEGRGRVAFGGQLVK